MAIRKCIYCGVAPEIKKIEGLYYVQCSNCHRHNLYSYVGRMESNAIAQWNVANAPYTPNQKIAIENLRLYPHRHPNRHRCVPCNIDGMKYKSLEDGAIYLGITSSWLRTLLSRAKDGTIEYKGHTITKGKNDE